MTLKIYIDGTWYSKEDAKISVFDHGFLYGDGVFEGIRSYDRLVFRFKEHLDRLYESAHTIMLDIPLTKKEMTAAVLTTLKMNKLKDAYVRLIVSRGRGDLGLDPKKCQKASIVIIADKIALYPKELYRTGLELITVPTMRNIPNALSPAIKSLNYLNNIMAKIEAGMGGYDEAIMLNHNGIVAECTGDNIFIIKNKSLHTPPSYVGALKGITRDAIIELAKKHTIACQESILTRHDLYNADEVFLTGTAAEVIPVIKIDERQIGTGKPGSCTTKLMKLFKQLTATDGVRYTI
ncbi:MAG: branched-chain-amino-acid transaminase [Candidatus Omnitrophica bacterium]|nr:branched-chain-amino-acid transaminase [Candidatus Omnitrophota bacterium]